MQLLNLIFHPYLVVCSFLLIVISGEHTGGFYAMYLFMALPYGSLHSLLGLAGVTLLLFSYHRFRRQYRLLAEPLLSFAGSACLVLSLFIFFYNDPTGYNLSTFQQWLPLATLWISALILFGFTIVTVANVILEKKNTW